MPKKAKAFIKSFILFGILSLASWVALGLLAMKWPITPVVALTLLITAVVGSLALSIVYGVKQFRNAKKVQQIELAIHQKIQADLEAKNYDKALALFLTAPKTPLSDSPLNGMLMHEAARTRNVAAIKALAKNNPDLVDAVCHDDDYLIDYPKSHTPLITAVCRGQLDAVKALLKAKATPSTQALCYAAERGYNFVVRDLVHAGCDVDTSAIRAAIRGGDPKTVQILLNTKEIDIYSNALHVAVAQNNHRILQALIDYGFDVNTLYGSPSRTPLQIAIENNDVQTLILLLQNDADPNRKTSNCISTVVDEVEYHGTALHTAARVANSDTFRALFAHTTVEIDIDALEHRGKSALYIALEKKKFDVARLLIEQGADVSMEYKITTAHRNGLYTTATVLALVKYAPIELLKLLVEKGADPQQRPGFHYASPFELVFTSGSPTLILLFGHEAFKSKYAHRSQIVDRSRTQSMLNHVTTQSSDCFGLYLQDYFTASGFIRAATYLAEYSPRLATTVHTDAETANAAPQPFEAEGNPNGWLHPLWSPNGLLPDFYAHDSTVEKRLAAKQRVFDFITTSDEKLLKKFAEDYEISAFINNDPALAKKIVTHKKAFLFFAMRPETFIALLAQLSYDDFLQYEQKFRDSIIATVNEEVSETLPILTWIDNYLPNDTTEVSVEQIYQNLIAQHLEEHNPMLALGLKGQLEDTLENLNALTRMWGFSTKLIDLLNKGYADIINDEANFVNGMFRHFSAIRQCFAYSNKIINFSKRQQLPDAIENNRRRGQSNLRALARPDHTLLPELKQNGCHTLVLMHPEQLLEAQFGHGVDLASANALETAMEQADILGLSPRFYLKLLKLDHLRAELDRLIAEKHKTPVQGSSGISSDSEPSEVVQVLLPAVDTENAIFLVPSVLSNESIAAASNEILETILYIQYQKLTEAEQKTFLSTHPQLGDIIEDRQETLYPEPLKSETASDESTESTTSDDSSNDTRLKQVTPKVILDTIATFPDLLLTGDPMEPYYLKDAVALGHSTAINALISKGLKVANKHNANTPNCFDPHADIFSVLIPQNTVLNNPHAKRRTSFSEATSAVSPLVKSSHRSLP